MKLLAHFPQEAKILKILARKSLLGKKIVILSDMFHDSDIFARLSQLRFHGELIGEHGERERERETERERMECMHVNAWKHSGHTNRAYFTRERRSSYALKEET